GQAAVGYARSSRGAGPLFPRACTVLVHREGVGPSKLFDKVFSSSRVWGARLYGNGRSRTSGRTEAGEADQALRAHQGPGRGRRRPPVPGGGGPGTSPHEGGGGRAGHGHRAG